jgi:hypothetical protein
MRSRLTRVAHGFRSQLVAAYLEFYQMQKPYPAFFGSRDFYSLVRAGRFLSL